MAEAVAIVSELAAKKWGKGNFSRMDVSWRTSQSELSPFSKGEGPGEIPKRVEESDLNTSQPVTIGRKSKSKSVQK